MVLVVRGDLEFSEMSAEQRLKELGIELPPAPKPMGLYKPMLLIGNMATLSGHGPLRSDGTLVVGRLGADMSLEEGQKAARQVGLAMLATLRSHLGSLDRIVRVVKLLGLVLSTDSFDQQPAVMNGCSQLFVDLWGAISGLARAALWGPIPFRVASLSRSKGPSKCWCDAAHSSWLILAVAGPDQKRPHQK